MERFNELINEILASNSLIKMVFSGLRKKSLPFKKVSIRPVIIQGLVYYQAEYHFDKKVTHENLDDEEFYNLCQDLLLNNFKQVNIFSISADYQILASKPEKPKIIKKDPSKTLECLEHNQNKKYIIPDGKPCDFLIRLGVMQKNGQVVPKYYAKFRQINRFLEIVSDVLEYLPNSSNSTDNKKPIKIIDFGCGKAYLTFALYYYLKLTLNRNVEIIGLDLKTDVINFCNEIANDLNYDKLKFQLGDIAEYNDAASADMVVTLHACDTATDYALIKAVNWKASVILSVPCCQHELFSQIKNDINDSLLKYGILKERFTAILTDGMRALKLEEYGYDISMIEFTSLEHTSKNIMIRGVKTDKKNMKSAEEFIKLKEYWNINPTIDQL
ncbi:class I SAM-dependent methyltransferase [Anaerovorax odorimutans]|uniref:class I SAM-dependent methyltransferase n=1 Tax=Anaerovorax odorimutans TaxID=109327 RepID=UPI000416B8BF|nr:SAM-dependent methyltransferase [Anaerovorax odorimutans]